ncbi:MAG: fumarate hydratase [Thermoplasmata archaeon]
MIPEIKIKEACIEILKRAVTELPMDTVSALRKGYENETDDLPRMQLRAILDNIELAVKTSAPMCQDTGVPIFFVNIGKVGIDGLDDVIREAVAEATETVPLRPNAVHPLTRKNPGTNVGERMPYINYRFSDNDYLEIGVMPKGAGSENMSRLAMLTPAKGLKGIKEFALETVLRAGGKPCPPVILGIGIGGSADIAMKLGKEALLRPLDERHPEKEIANLEREIFEAINDIGIGPMGTGGKTTLLGVNAEYAYCHTASLPVAINIQCWAARRSLVRMYPDGRVEYPLEVIQ